MTNSFCLARKSGGDGWEDAEARDDSAIVG